MRCSYCWNREGHNRLGCPKRKAIIIANPDGWEATREAQRQTALTKRKCSYCRKVTRQGTEKEQASAFGHNRRSCKKLATASAKAKKLCRKWRQDLKDTCKTEGVGVGALLSVPQDEWSNNGEYTPTRRLLLVTGISFTTWDHQELNHESANTDMRCNPWIIQGRWVHNNQKGSSKFPKLIHSDYESGFLLSEASKSHFGSEGCTIVAPSKGELGFTDSWINDEKAVDHLFR